MIACLPVIDYKRSIAWAVYLGANTAQRLSKEWLIAVDLAENLLENAVSQGLITKIDLMAYQCLPGGEL